MIGTSSLRCAGRGEALASGPPRQAHDVGLSVSDGSAEFIGQHEQQVRQLTSIDDERLELRTTVAECIVVQTATVTLAKWSVPLLTCTSR